MNWTSIHETWNALRARFSADARGRAQGSPAQSRSHRYLRGCADISGREAGRRKQDWMRDPGVLDDWNDTRSILDM